MLNRELVELQCDFRHRKNVTEKRTKPKKKLYRKHLSAQFIGIHINFSFEFRSKFVTFNA